MKERTARMCACFKLGMPVQEIANTFGVQRPAVYRALITGGLKEPYKAREEGGSGRPIGGGQRGYTARRAATRIQHAAAQVQARLAAEAAPRVHRDPCPRCGCRGDVDCGHSRAPLGMGAFA